ncbi:MAG: TetR/AcrR family transcriptional regulator [Pseudomonas sp.]
MSKSEQAPLAAKAIPPTGGLRERNKREKLARITSAAAEVFASPKGFAGATTQEIARLADVGTGTLFAYITAKEDLLILVLRADMEEMMDGCLAEACNQEHLDDMIISYCLQAVAYWERDIATARELARHAMSVTDERRRADISYLMKKILRQLAQIIALGKTRREIRADVPALALARNIFAAHYLFTQQWLNGFISRSDYEKNLRTSISLQLRGLAPSAARSKK